MVKSFRPSGWVVPTAVSFSHFDRIWESGLLPSLFISPRLRTDSVEASPSREMKRPWGTTHRPANPAFEEEIEDRSSRSVKRV